MGFQAWYAYKITINLQYTSIIAYQEIAQLARLSEIIAGEVTSFAYPNGLPFLDFSSRHVQLVKKAGYTSAVATQMGMSSDCDVTISNSTIPSGSGSCK